ncbi:unnamed protein product [Prorocentrum cordatum]|uniref:Pentatricopeptide repeat-containing protein, chloroplastic n=2 Tax=Prorocentrum cordatum TaxID=2364126 RepID=A0ABN9U665_9DINO|nr:unnamed protein product [Polarella glacialis]
MSFEASIKNCGLIKRWSAALRLLREGIQLGVQLVPSHYIATVSACRTGGQWQRALSVLRSMWEAKLERNMREAKLEPNVISCNAGISACAKGEQWQRALKGEQWQRALALLSEMWEAKLEPDGEQWQRALALLSEMWEAKLEPNVISYSAGISACEKGEQWQRALALLSEMWEAKLEPDVISYSRWDQRVREGQAVAACADAASRDAGGEVGAQRHSSTLRELYSRPAGLALQLLMHVELHFASRTWRPVLPRSSEARGSWPGATQRPRRGNGGAR